MIRRRPPANGTLRDSSGRLVILAPRRHRTAVAVLCAAVLGVAGFVVGQRALQQATASVPAGSPFGHFDSIAAVPGGVTLTGWAIDPNAQLSAINVAVLSDGRTVATAGANGARPDVAAHYPGTGANHGYTVTALVPEGTHQICVTAINVGAGANRSLGCRTMSLNYSPIGQVDTLATTPGHVVVQGWTFDPDSPSTALTVYVSIDSTRTSMLANASRPDVAAVYPVAGAGHGYAATLPMTDGTHSVCVIAKNIRYGADKTLRCASLTLADSPIGHLDSAQQTPGGYHLAGWVFDPNAPTTSLTMNLTVDGKALPSFAAGDSRPDVARSYPAAGANHGFTAAFTLTQGAHPICLTAVNIGYGSNRNLICQTITVNFNPSATMTTLAPTRDGATVTGWAADPDTSAPIHVLFTADGHQVSDVVANGAGPAHSGHLFAQTIVLASGLHTICAVGVNVDFGTGNSPPACGTINLTLSPFGSLDSVVRANGSTALVVTGWALDPDSGKNAISTSISVDGTARTVVANATRPDVGAVYPAYGSVHGFSVTIPASDWEHRVCVSALNVGGGANAGLGCKIINAVHPVVPSAPRSVAAVAGFGGATINWTPPSSDGGAPWSKYTITASPGGASSTTSAAVTTATIVGLADKTTYTFTVVATNVAGNSAPGTSSAVTTLAAPPPQTTPAPISTSRYIRNIHAATGSDLAAMTAEGVADAKANPSGHGYLVLLDIGGQDQTDGGVVLSATTQFVAYADLAKDLIAYVDGYHSAQRSSAPVTIAIGTNNDMDVSSSSGATWAGQVIGPVAAHAASYLGMTIAGANDIEPGFRGGYSATRSWLLGYLGATKAPFVFNGSADGCSWTATNSQCNNGWSMSGLYYLAAGAAPVRIINLPQVYNNAMAGQWTFISLTGVGQSTPRIDFGGTLTEWTACTQAGGCGSLTGNTAWQVLWNDLQAHSATKVGSLPYSTDLRIDR